MDQKAASMLQALLQQANDRPELAHGIQALTNYMQQARQQPHPDAPAGNGEDAPGANEPKADLTAGGAIKLLAQAYARLVHHLKNVARQDAQTQPVSDNDNTRRPSANTAQLLVKLLHIILTGADATASHYMNFYNTFTVLVPFPSLEDCPVEEVPVAFAATQAGHFLTEYFTQCGTYVARMPHMYGNKCSQKDVPTDTCVPAAGGKVVYRTELAYAKQDTLLNMPLVFALAFKVIFRYFCRDYQGYLRGMASFDNSGMEYLSVFRCGSDAGIKVLDPDTGKPDGLTRIMCNLLKKLQKSGNSGGDQASASPVYTFTDIRYESECLP